MKYNSKNEPICESLSKTSKKMLSQYGFDFSTPEQKWLKQAVNNLKDLRRSYVNKTSEI